MKWQSNQSNNPAKIYSIRVVSICLLLIIFPYSCSKTATGMWVGASVGAAAFAPAGYASVNSESCYSCSPQKHLSDNVYTMIGLGLFGFILGGLVGGLLGNYFEEEKPLVPLKANKKVFDEKAALKKLYFSAIRIGDVTVLDKLLTKHPHYITSIDNKGLTGLHHTAKLGYKKASQTLLIHGINIDALDYKGRTPLHYAAIHKQSEIYQYLVEEGADVSIKDNKGKTAAEYLALNNQQYKKLFENSLANTNADIKVISNSLDGLTNLLNLETTN